MLTYMAKKLIKKKKGWVETEIKEKKGRCEKGGKSK
jgi:hypothetical protein